MSIMLNIFDVSIKEKTFYRSLCFELLPQQICHSKKEIHGPIPACKLVQADRVGDPIFNLNGILRVTYVTWAVK